MADQAKPEVVIEGILGCEEIRRGDGCYGCGGQDFDELSIDGKPLTEFEVGGDTLDWWPSDYVKYLDGRQVRLRARIELFIEDVEPATPDKSSGAENA